MAGTTNQLVEWAREIGPMHDAREYDTIVATGEQVTVGLLAIALQNIGIDARSWLGWQMPLKTDEIHGSARILDIDTVLMRERLLLARWLSLPAFRAFLPMAGLRRLAGVVPIPRRWHLLRRWRLTVVTSTPMLMGFTH